MTADPLPRPPPWTAPYESFVAHYLYHLARTGRRPTLGELALTSRLSRQSCRRFRARHEAAIRAAERG